MNRSGLVLVLVLLTVLALELLAMSAFAVARVAQLGSRVARTDAALQVAADDAAEQAAAALDAVAVDTHAVGVSWSSLPEVRDGVEIATELRRLRGGFVLVHARATPARGSPARAAALVRFIEPAAVLAAFPAVFSAPGGDASPHTESPPQPECAIDRGYAPPALPRMAELQIASLLPLGDDIRLAWSDAERIADAHAQESDSSAAAPVLLFLDGPATLSGRFRGILLVDGDLTLTPDADLRGLVSIRGSLRFPPGARILGAVRAGAVEDAGGAVVYDRCAIEAALTAPALTRPYRPGPRWRLPAF